MKRRNFLSSMILAGIGSMILPSATTYQRIWVPEKKLVGIAFSLGGGSEFGLPGFPKGGIEFWSRSAFERYKLIHSNPSIRQCDYMVEFLSEKYVGDPHYKGSCIDAKEEVIDVRAFHTPNKNPVTLPTSVLLVWQKAVADGKVV